MKIITVIWIGLVIVATWVAAIAIPSASLGMAIALGMIVAVQWFCVANMCLITWNWPLYKRIWHRGV